MPSRSPADLFAATRLAAFDSIGPQPSPLARNWTEETAFDWTGEFDDLGACTVSGGADILPVGLVRGG